MEVWCSPGVCPPQAPLGQLAALVGAPQAPPEVNPSEVTSPPETSLEPAAGAAGGQPAAGAGVFPFFPTKGVTRLVGKYPRGKMYQRPTNQNEPSCWPAFTV